MVDLTNSEFYVYEPSFSPIPARLRGFDALAWLSEVGIPERMAVHDSSDSFAWTCLRNELRELLFELWETGALADGASPDQSYYVRCDLNDTMSPEQAQRGELVVRVGVATAKAHQYTVLEVARDAVA